MLVPVFCCLLLQQCLAADNLSSCGDLSPCTTSLHRALSCYHDSLDDHSLPARATSSCNCQHHAYLSQTGLVCWGGATLRAVLFLAQAVDLHSFCRRLRRCCRASLPPSAACLLEMKKKQQYIHGCLDRHQTPSVGGSAALV
jgi:hypothetical protein